MNLTKWFNLPYAKQNIKKSKGVLALFLGIVPIFTALVLFMMAKYYVTPPSLSEISIINIIFFCIIPIVVSLCLFNYIYKKKSVDFICSMPISRKTIFITNVVTGIFLIFIMNLITSIIILLLSLGSGLIIPITMIIDFLLLWMIAYTYIFTVTNLAMSISGNAITQLIITGILLIIVPLMHDYTFNNQIFNNPTHIKIECKNNICTPDNYECYNDDICKNDKKNNSYNISTDKTIKSQTYPMPYSIFKELANNDNDINLMDKNVIIEMLVLIVGNTILGFYLFNKRKMENNETSFKNYKVHLLVKGITLLPALVFTYEIFNSRISILEEAIILTIMIAYYLIYELITRKGIYHLKDNIIAFCLTLIIGYGLISGINLLSGNNNAYLIKNNDIKEASIYLNNQASITEEAPIKITNSSLIGEVLKYSFNKYDNKDITDLKVKLTLKNHYVVYYTVWLPISDLNKLSDKIKDSKEYKAYLDINSNDIYAIAYDTSYYYKSDKKIKKILQEAIKKYPLQTKENNNYYQYITFLTYKNGKKVTYKVETTATKDLTNYVNEMVKITNKRTISMLDEFGYFEYYNLKDDITIDEKLFNNNYLGDYIKDFIISHQDEEFNQNKDYITIKFNTFSNDNNYYFVTNDVEGFTKLVHEKYREYEATTKKENNNDTN